MTYYCLCSLSSLSLISVSASEDSSTIEFLAISWNLMDDLSDEKLVL